MYKHSKYMALMSIVVAYVFIIGLLGEQGDNFNVKFGLSVAMMIGVVFFSFRTFPQFSIKTVVKGEKHREDLLNVVIPFLYPVIMAVLFYSTTGINQDYELPILIVLTGLLLVGAILQYVSYYVVLEEDGITANQVRKSPLISFKKASIKYKDITNVGFFYNLIVIRDHEKAIYLKMGVVDMKNVLNTLSEYLSEELYKEAFDNLKGYFIKKKLQSNIDAINYYNNK